MTRNTHVAIAGAVLVAAGAAGAGYWWRNPDLPSIAVETLRRRDLDAFVSASGKIQPQRQVNVSANTMGRVTRLAVREGET